MDQLRLKPQELSQHFLIRPINPGDVDEEQAVVDLLQISYRSNLGWNNESGIVRGQRVTLPVLQREASAPDGVLLVAEERATGEVVGCVKSDLIESSFGVTLSEKMGHFGMFAVVPRHQGKGLGSYLLSHAEDRCRESGMSKMIIEVLDVRTSLIEWYERCGYQKQDGRIDADQFMKDKGEVLLVPANFIRMVKEMKA